MPTAAPQSTTTWRNSWLHPRICRRKTRAALVERDPAKRLDMYRELQRDVMKESPWAITFQAQAQVALRSEVKGFVHGPDERPRLLSRRDQELTPKSLTPHGRDCLTAIPLAASCQTQGSET